jgi:hypothetical protein
MKPSISMKKKEKVWPYIDEFLKTCGLDLVKIIPNK